MHGLRTGYDYSADGDILTAANACAAGFRDPALDGKT
jgi:hypothetical protein